MRITPFPKSRELVYGLLERSKAFHAPISMVVTMDVTNLLTRLESEPDRERRIGLLAYLIKATSWLLEKYPRLNHHLFHGLTRRYEVDFGEISCNLVILRRTESKESILLPVIMRNSNRRSLVEIQREIRRYRRTPLDQLPEIAAIQKARELPRLATKYFNFKCRSDPAFYRRYFGTYGMSSILHDHRGKIELNKIHASLTQVYVNTAAAFLPSTVTEEPRVIAGEVVARRVLTMTTMIDHHLIDGHEALFALEELVDVVEHGRLLPDPP